MIGPLRHALLERITDPDRAYDTPADELLPLQMAAAQELFAEHVIPVIQRETGAVAVEA